MCLPALPATLGTHHVALLGGILGGHLLVARSNAQLLGYAPVLEDELLAHPLLFRDSGPAELDAVVKQLPDFLRGFDARRCASAVGGRACIKPENRYLAKRLAKQDKRALCSWPVIPQNSEGYRAPTARLPRRLGNLRLLDLNVHG